MGIRYSALDLYGGADNVFGKMTSTVRKRLNTKVFSKGPEHVAGWADWCGFDDDYLAHIKRFADGSDKVDFMELHHLGEAVDVEISHLLQELVFMADSKKYWTGQLKENPMLIGGTRPSGKIEKDAELRFYVEKIAIAELIEVTKPYKTAASLAA